VVGIVPNDGAIMCLVSAVLRKQDEHCPLMGPRMFSAKSMAAFPGLEDWPALLSAPARDVPHPQAGAINLGAINHCHL